MRKLSCNFPGRIGTLVAFIFRAYYIREASGSGIINANVLNNLRIIVVILLLLFIHRKVDLENFKQKLHGFIVCDTEQKFSHKESSN